MSFQHLDIGNKVESSAAENSGASEFLIGTEKLMANETTFVREDKQRFRVNVD